MRLYKLVVTILKAYMLKMREHKREEFLTSYVQKKLREFKMRRMFRAIR
jgi:hypothetical protein